MMKKFNLLEKFFLFCSGTSIDLISKCPKFEVIKYISIGATIFFTSILAFVSSFFAFSIILKSIYFIFFSSLFWSFIIFNLDRYIVSSLRSNENILKNFLKAFPRIVVGVFIAISISKPIEIKLLSNEISNYIENEKVSKIENLNVQYNFNVKELDERKDKIIESYNQKLFLQEQYYNDYKCECDGTCGTLIRGRGIECFSKKKKYEDFLSQMVFERNQYEFLIQENNRERQVYLNQHEKSKAEAKASLTYGFFNQVEILNKLENNSIYFIVFIFILIELSPIFTKLFSSYGPYESLLMSEINQYKINYLKTVDNLKNERIINKKINDLKVKEQIKVTQLEIEKTTNEKAMERYDEIKEQLIRKISQN